MKVSNIIVSPFQFTTLTRCDFSHSIGKHSEAVIAGYIKENDKEIYMSKIGESTEVSVTADTGETLFIGIIKNADISKEGHDLYKLTLYLISYSFLMDNIRRTRIFQQPETTYNELLSHVNKTYDGSMVMSVASGEPIEKIITQYRETDWEFVSRVASRFNETVTPAYLFSGVKYYFGIPQNSESIDLKMDKVSAVKAVGSYTNKKMNDVSISESDEIIYEVTSRDFAKISDDIYIDDFSESAKVYAIKSWLEKEELVHTYFCKPENGFKVKQHFGDYIIGASLEGFITEIKQDIVKVFVPSSDTEQETDKTIWIPYSTVYSSPDGTGWYAMPEIGDSVRVYFPSEKEDEAYIISATHLENSEDLRQNPNHKSIRSKYGKEVEFTESTIRISNNNGMEILIDDTDGISITSDKKISFVSDESVSLSSLNAEMTVVAKDNVSIVQNDTAVVLEENIGMSGAQVHVQQ